MRVAYLNPCGRMGGAETSLRELLAAVRAAEPSWELWLVLGEDGPLAETARAQGVRVLLLPFPAALARLGDAGNGQLRVVFSMMAAIWAIAKYTRQLAVQMKALRPDIVHTNGLKMHFLGAAARPKSVPVLWHIHDYVSTRPVMRYCLRFCRKRCHLAIVNSHSTKQDFESVFPGVKVVTVYNAVDTQRFAPGGTNADLDRLSGMPPAAIGTLRVGLIATFARWKGHKIFLQALAALRGNVKVRGYIIGGPVYRTNGSQWSWNELQEEADQLGLSRDVGFTGFVEDTASVIRSLDILVHASSLPEPFGMVIIEGMACGKPVIVSKDGGASELFTDGENALSHTRGSVDELAERIAELASNPELRKRLGEAGRATAERVFDGSRLAQEITGVYRSVLLDEAMGGKPALLDKAQSVPSAPAR